ncbi:MAG TPA: mercury(II) reductase [Candidatus Limnocylindrales bacterium]|nr:mercury(II) reductase [Candidatus Limnocylindrales bacterium]
MANRYDLLVLGAGSTAFAAAIRAHELGARIGMVERRTLGGTCANRGCLPSKNLLEAARQIHAAMHPRFPGIAPAPPAVDLAALLAQKDEVVHAYRHDRYGAVAEGLERLELIEGEARFEDGHRISVARPDGERLLEADHLLIATGSAPSLPDLPGLAGTPYLTSDLLDADEPGRLARLPESLIVLGGGYVAVELGQLFARLGCRVTLVVRGDRLLPEHEPELAALLADALAAEGIAIETGVRPLNVAGDETALELELESTGGPRTLRAERLLVAAGRTPATAGLALARAGVQQLADGSVAVDAELRTSQRHVFAAGDVIGSQHGSQAATPVGARQGRIAAENALGGAGRRFDPTVVPRAVFSDPPVASVGLTEAQVRSRRLPAVTTTTPLALVPRAAAIHRAEGVVKIVASTIDERVLGVHMIGESAHEVIGEAAMALRFGAKLPDLVDLVHVYPTMSEALKIGALAFSRDVRRLSCCAE